MIYEEFKNKKPTLWRTLESNGFKHLVVCKPEYNKDSDSFHYCCYMAEDNSWVDNIGMREAYNLFKAEELSTNKEDWPEIKPNTPINNKELTKYIEANKNFKAGFLSYYCNKFCKNNNEIPTKNDLQEFIFIEQGVDLKISDKEYIKALRIDEIDS